MTILATEILFIDEDAPEWELKERFFWEKGSIFLEEVCAFHVFVHKRETFPFTEVYLKSGNTFVVKHHIKSFESIMEYVCKTTVTQ